MVATVTVNMLCHSLSGYSLGSLCLPLYSQSGLVHSVLSPEAWDSH